MKRLTLWLACLFIGMSVTIAQTRQVSGTVADEAGDPVIGALVVVKGDAAVGTVTDLDGKFTLNVPASAQTLVIKFLGMQEQEVAVASNMKITLHSSDSILDEVIVVAYGTAKKSSFAGSASVIKGEELEKMQSSNLSKALEGKVAGIETTSGTGQPGAGASIIVRGLGSISASRSPLIILDGVPYEGSLNSISSFDVEAMTVLKDAAANSIYGARGSNGVIIITTKKGKTGKARVNFDARFGANSRGIPTYNVITDPGEFYEMYWESLRNKNLDNGLSYMSANQAASAGLINGGLRYNLFKGIPNDQLIDPVTGKLNPNANERKWNDNWLTDPFRSGMRQEYNISVSSGTENNNLYLSLSYLSDEGYVVNSDFNRISARLKTEQKIGDYVKVGGSINYAKTDMNNANPSSSTNYSNIFMFGQQIAPIFPIYIYDLNTGDPILDRDGKKQYDFGETYARPYAAQQNPMATLAAGENTILVDVMSSRGFFEVNFLKDFKFTTNISYDIFNSNEATFMTPIGGDALNVGGRGYRQMTRYSAMNVNELLNYNRKFGAHTVDVLLGHEAKKDQENYLYGHMTNYVDPNNSEFANATLYQNLTSAYTEYTLEGYFSRLDYNYDDKYYATASLRSDGSSRFHPDVRKGTFWALGASWRVSKESFLQDISFINDLKLKVSYGTQGNDNLLNSNGTPMWYGYRNLYSVDRVDGEGAISWAFRGNPDLTWEKSNNFNTGLEFSGWNERLVLNFDYFIKETKDLLYQKPKAASEGLPSFQWVNDIDMKNTGVELELAIDVVKTNDFKWNINLNATHYKNQLTKLPEDKQILIDRDGGYQAGSYWRKIGGSIYDFYTYEYAGVDPVTGLAQYNQYVKDDDGVETVEVVNATGGASLRETGKSAIPDLYGGAGTSIEFKGFDFSVHTAFQLGGYVMDGAYQNFMNAGDAGRNFHKDMFQRWTPEHPETNVPKLLYESVEQNGSSDRWLTKASYFSLRNITLGYTLPKKATNYIKLERLRFYAVADNVWYVSNRKGLDVRQSFSGDATYVYSPLRTISFGISANF